MKYLLVLMVILTTQAFAESKKDEIKKAADIEKILRQQRELEADELLVRGQKEQKIGDYEDALENYKKAIHLYEKSSASEKRIMTKITNSKILLAQSYKLYAEKVIKQADKESSVKLYNKAEKLLLAAKKATEEAQKLK